MFQKDLKRKKNKQRMIPEIIEIRSFRNPKNEE